ncbi:DNA polymerase/3'-5' exonuclease PolX [Halobacteriales archaeon QS_1_69_70]|nr:MAG: DNA polymerase/3'-5' exonuclease PolX [Halobacteriales archaeon QS_1_69_70]
MSRNAEVASRLEEMADHLEARDVDYKPRAYRQAAESIRAHAVAVETLLEAEGEDALTEIDDVGEAIAGKTADYLETGEIEELAALREELPVDMDALTAVDGVGPKTVAALYEALEVEDLDDLEAAAEAGDIRDVSGFGPKTESNVLENIPFARESRERSRLGAARPVADRVLAFFEDVDAVERVDVAGSIRRWRATIGDVDVLAASDDGAAVVEAFETWDEADDVIEAGTNKASVRADGTRVDLRVVVPGEFGAALQYFTGSKDHNVTVRNRAIERDLKVNEYGVFNTSAVEDPDDGEGTESARTPSDGRSDGSQRVGDRVAGETEAGVYDALGMAWVPPELREDRGEVAADVGHDFVAITDHATGPGMVGGVGLDDDELREQIEEIRAVADDADVSVFAGVEANVGPDGEVSVGDDVLAALDCVVASPHSDLDGDGTDRLLAAIEHPEVDVVGHPTGRKLNQRPGIDVDVRQVAEAAADHGVALEINANPRRLDLRATDANVAVEAGATITVNTDAHRPGSYEYLRYGVHTARRGWCEPGDVLNCRDADGVRAFLED